MLSDVLKAVELLMDAVRNAKSPEKKRRQVADRLLGLYLDIKNIVERGNEILSDLRDAETFPSVPLGKLTAQQEAIQNFFDDLNDIRNLGVLQLHLPRFTRDLQALFFQKLHHIEILSSASHLLTGEELDELRRYTGRRRLRHKLSIYAIETRLVQYAEGNSKLRERLQRRLLWSDISRSKPELGDAAVLLSVRELIRRIPVEIVTS